MIVEQNILAPFEEGFHSVYAPAKKQVWQYESKVSPPAGQLHHGREGTANGTVFHLAYRSDRVQDREGRTGLMFRHTILVPGEHTDESIDVFRHIYAPDPNGELVTELESIVERTAGAPQSDANGILAPYFTAASTLLSTPRARRARDEPPPPEYGDQARDDLESVATPPSDDRVGPEDGLPLRERSSQTKLTAEVTQLRRRVHRLEMMGITLCIAAVVASLAGLVMVSTFAMLCVRWL